MKSTHVRITSMVIMQIACGLAIISISKAGLCNELVDYANPMIGTVPSGHVFPGATVPFGMAQVSPDTRLNGWDGCSGYDYYDSVIFGFSFNHLTGTGAIDLGNFRLMPTVGELKLEPGRQFGEGYCARFSHDQEEAHPGYYRVFLPDNKVNVELAATARVGLQRYTFLEKTNVHIVLDLWQGVGNQAEQASITIENNHTISGYRKEDGHSMGGSKIYYFVAEFSKPFASVGINLDGNDTNAMNIVGHKIIAYFDYATKSGEKLVVKLALSSVSEEGARKNMKAELPGWDFDAVVSQARDQWNKEFSKMPVESKDKDLLQTFYTALYHAEIAPIVFSDVDGQFRGPDGKVHQAKGFDYYSSLSVWDTFRAEQSLLTLTQPQRINDIIRTMLDHYKILGEHMLPNCAYSGKEIYGMIGNPSIPVIAEAYNKGFRGWDTNEALQAVVGAAEREDERHVTFKGYSDYRRQGWIPVNFQDNQQQCVSKVLEFAYEDACVARFARALGREDVASIYAKRSTNWHNVYNYTTGFVQGRTTNGDWVIPFDPSRIDHQYYTEANAWQYSFFVPHNVPGLIAAMGGEDKFVAMLDEMFDTKAAIPNLFKDHDVTGIIGMYAQGNEPCHSYPYLYSYAGRPWKTQFRVRQIAGTLYNNTPDGLCGNDDCGQMSAWYVFAAIGFYPADPPTGVYVIGSPLVDKATIKLNPDYYHGGTFTVIAKNNSPKNVYIQSATLNGKMLARSWITHDEIVQGGTLELTMGPLPNRDWATVMEDRPAQPLIP